MLRLIAPLLVVAACSKSQPAQKRVTCEEYMKHVGEITHFTTPEPYGEAEIKYCESHTQEQLRCVMAATSPDEFSLCEQIADTKQRAIAARVLPQIRAQWPGTATPMDIVKGAEGCAFAMIAGGAVPPTENEVRGSFALRPPGKTGDAQNIIVRMRRDGTTWRCNDEGDVVACETLKLACRGPN